MDNHFLLIKQEIALSIIKILSENNEFLNEISMNKILDLSELEVIDKIFEGRIYNVSYPELFCIKNKILSYNLNKRTKTRQIQEAQEIEEVIKLTRKKPIKCSNCKQKITDSNRTKYCSAYCMEQVKGKEYVEKWRKVEKQELSHAQKRRKAAEKSKLGNKLSYNDIEPYDPVSKRFKAVRG